MPISPIMKKISAFTVILLMLTAAGCATKKSVKVSKQKIAPGSSIVVIINCPSNIQNVVLAKFMSRDFRVKAFNASDLYTSQDVFDVKDMKKIAYTSNIAGPDSIFASQKLAENIYKLHIYNYEISKAETLAELKDKWNVQYLVLLELNDWENVSWGRAINLASYELVWIENYPTRYKDTLETVADHMIRSMSGM